MRRSLSLLLSLNAGYVDTAGFLALKGLFTAHVTGNFVTLGSSLVFGTSGTLSKLLALPVFCAVVFVAALTADRLRRRQHRPALRLALMIQVLLLVAGGCSAVWLGPFDDGDTVPALATGMTLVAAMAIQNAAHRMYLAAAPPTTLMTGTTTQLMIDLAEVVLGSSSEAAQMSARAKRMVATIIVFAPRSPGTRASISFSTALTRSRPRRFCHQRATAHYSVLRRLRRFGARDYRRLHATVSVHGSVTDGRAVQ